MENLKNKFKFSKEKDKILFFSIFFPKTQKQEKIKERKC